MEIIQGSSEEGKRISKSQMGPWSSTGCACDELEPLVLQLGDEERIE